MDSGAFWEKIPTWIKIAVTVAAVVWTAGVASADFLDIPARLNDHEARITLLEQLRTQSTDRNNRNFIYVACRLDELATASTGARCDLILDDTTRSLLEQLRTP